MNKIKLMFLLTVFSLTAATASVVAYTYAAYLNAFSFDLPIDLNTTAVSSKFSGGGSGTLAAPYMLGTPDDLRNLQKLNVLGVFSKSTYFKISGNITWSGSALLPIGNEDYPFYSQFNGNGYTISGLVVNGANTNDIGMFGYAAMGSNIKNLILSSPIINVLPNNTGTVTYAPTTNPMEAVLSTAGINIGNLAFTNVTPARFTVPTSTVTGTDGVVYNVVYQSTDTALLYESSAGVWTCGIPNTTKPTTLYPVQLIARAFALYNDKIISYTLERWQVNVNGNGTVTVGSTTVNPGYFKIVHSLTDPHQTYAGFFVGHLDGIVAYLGLYGGNSSGALNSKITVIGRNALSYGSLIGRSRLDNPYDDSAALTNQKVFDFNQIIPANGLYGTSFPMSTYRTTSPSTYFSQQAANAITATQQYGLSATDTNYLRFYPGLSNTRIANPESPGTYLYVMQTTQALGASVKAEKKTKWKNYTYFNQTSVAQNGLWLWLNAIDSTLGKHILSSGSFTVSIQLYYVATGNSTNNKFQILYNIYNPNLTTQPLSYVGNDHWANLANQSGVYVPNNHPVVANGTIAMDTISFTVDTTQSFWVNSGDGTNSNGYFPMIAVGVGKASSVSTQNITDPDYRYYYDDFAADPFTLNIIKETITFTSNDGAVSTQISNADFLYTIPTRSVYFVNDTYTAWNQASNVKIQFAVSNYLQNAAGTTYSYYRANSTDLMYTKVNVLYTAGTSFAPFNTVNYDTAILSGSL